MFDNLDRVFSPLECSLCLVVTVISLCAVGLVWYSLSWLTVWGTFVHGTEHPVGHLGTRYWTPGGAPWYTVLNTRWGAWVHDTEHPVGHLCTRYWTPGGAPFYTVLNTRWGAFVHGPEHPVERLCTRYWTSGGAPWYAVLNTRLP